MVVSDSAPASRIGREVLRAGGSAVDAAVATALALAVSWPDAGNIGGGGFMLVRPADGSDPVCVDYRETAPAVMHPRSFNKDDTTFTHKAVGVPGTVRGLAAAHERFGKLPWRELVMPAVRLARDGVPIDRPLADSLNSVLGEKWVLTDPRFAELRRVYGRPDGEAWETGDRLRLPDLADTLTKIADQGPDAFYTGEIAQAIVDEMNRGDGLISRSDLENYQAKIRPAIRGEYRGFTILGAPPPSSGGICVVEALNILENFDLGGRDRYDPITIHLIAESLRRAFADRARYLGDPDFAEIPNHLTDKDYARQLAASIDLTAATTSADVTPEIEIAGESPDTTHFSIVDADGMAVSNTYTLEASWGSRIVVKGVGFVLNNEMGDFNWFPGETNSAGRIGTEANTVIGGKRMLSSQAPTIVERDGRLVLVTGSPGGRTILSTALCVVVNVIDFQQAPAEAVAGARMHHQWFPDRIELERIEGTPHAEVVEALSAMGHSIRGRAAQGSAHTIAVDAHSKQLTGVADFRRGGRPAALDSHQIAIWDFAEEAETPLEATSCTAEASVRWRGAMDDARTDGLDNLRIGGAARDKPRASRFALPVSIDDCSVEIKIDSASFSGDEKSEQVDFALFGGPDANQLVAQISFGRRGDDQILLSGRTDRDMFDLVTLSVGNRLDQPMILKMTLNQKKQLVQFASRSAGSDTFIVHGTTQVRAEMNATQFELSVRNDLSDDGEFVNVDRIELISSLLPDAATKE